MTRLTPPLAVALAIAGSGSAARDYPAGRPGADRSDHVAAGPYSGHRAGSASSRRSDRDRRRRAPSTRSRFFVDDVLVGEDPEGPDLRRRSGADKNPFVPSTIRAEAVRRRRAVGADSVDAAGRSTSPTKPESPACCSTSRCSTKRAATSRADARSLRGATRTTTSQTIDLLDAAHGADHAHAARGHEQQHVVSLRLRPPRRAPARAAR